MSKMISPLGFEAHTFGGGAPVVGILAGIHGNERTGMAAVARLLARLRERPPARGTVIVVPIANPTAASAGLRCAPEDDLDLNRCFPGDAAGSLSQRLAAALWAETADADWLVDVHCCRPGGMAHSLCADPDVPALRALADRLGLPETRRSAGTGGQLFIEAWRRRGQPAQIVELPDGSTPGAIDEDAAALGLAALLRLLTALGMLDE